MKLDAECINEEHLHKVSGLYDDLKFHFGQPPLHATESLLKVSVAEYWRGRLLLKMKLVIQPDCKKGLQLVEGVCAPALPVSLSDVVEEHRSSVQRRLAEHVVVQELKGKDLESAAECSFFFKAEFDFSDADLTTQLRHLACVMSLAVYDASVEPDATENWPAVSDLEAAMAYFRDHRQSGSEIPKGWQVYPCLVEAEAKAVKFKRDMAVDEGLKRSFAAQSSGAEGASILSVSLDKIDLSSEDALAASYALVKPPLKQAWHLLATASPRFKAMNVRLVEPLVVHVSCLQMKFRGYYTRKFFEVLEKQLTSLRASKEQRSASTAALKAATDASQMKTILEVTKASSFENDFLLRFNAGTTLFGLEAIAPAQADVALESQDTLPAMPILPKAIDDLSAAARTITTLENYSQLAMRVRAQGSEEVINESEATYKEARLAYFDDIELPETLLALLASVGARARQCAVK